jgi:hypothetical protein
VLQLHRLAQHRKRVQLMRLGLQLASHKQLCSGSLDSLRSVQYQLSIRMYHTRIGSWGASSTDSCRTRLWQPICSSP